MTKAGIVLCRRASTIRKCYVVDANFYICEGENLRFLKYLDTRGLVLNELEAVGNTLASHRSGVESPFSPEVLKPFSQKKNAMIKFIHSTPHFKYKFLYYHHLSPHLRAYNRSTQRPAPIWSDSWAGGALHRHRGRQGSNPHSGLSRGCLSSAKMGWSNSIVVFIVGIIVHYLYTI